MKVKVINRSETEFTKRRSGDPNRVFRNPDPLLHPLERAREVKRAINAAKLDRIFAKPFLKAYPHSDSITCLEVNPKRLDRVVVGCADGSLWQWDLANDKTILQIQGHKNSVSGLGLTPDGLYFLTCSTDSSIKIWSVDGDDQGKLDPMRELPGTQSYRCLSHHWMKPHFIAGGSIVELWDHHRSQPIGKFSWGTDSITSVKFNPVEMELFGSTGSDRSIVLYDVRASSPVRKLIMQTRSNALSWNPMEAMNFVVANEDCNLYTYDLRRLDAAQIVHKGFVSSVMDVDFSPTGCEFVAAGYDRTLRLFESGGSGSRDVYFTPRMSRVATVRFSRDATYVFSGSDDMNIRLWKVRYYFLISAYLFLRLMPRSKWVSNYHKNAKRELIIKL